MQSGNNDVIDQGKKVLTSLKLAMLQAPANDTLQMQSAQALELGVLLSVMDGDLDAFGRNMAQLQPYYMNGLVTPRKNHITGLNLMNLLVDNRLAEFHSCLEWLNSHSDVDSIVQDPLISFPISLERKLMVGIYDEVLTGSIPHPSFQFFMSHLLQTVRDSIADCMEVSYPTLQVSQAAALMKFQNLQELKQYIDTDREDWMVDEAKGVLTFAPAEAAAAANTSTTAAAFEDVVPSMQWIQQSLTYATEMERIV